MRPPEYPYPPSLVRPGFVGGAQPGFSAQTALRLRAARGSFDSAIVSYESGQNFQIFLRPQQTENSFSLQLNTNNIAANQLPAGLCQGTLCVGWQQFVYSNNSGLVFIQYWLVNYGLPVPPGGVRPACPAGWSFHPGSAVSASGCYKNGAGAASVDRQPISQLSHLSLVARSNAIDSEDSVVLEMPGKIVGDYESNVLNLAQNWNTAEFNIFGDCCESEAYFAGGTSLDVRTETNIVGGGGSHPTCVQQTFTAETNNLTLIASPFDPSVFCSEYYGESQRTPAIIFRESQTGALPEPVFCYVYDDGFTNVAGWSDSIFINGNGQACVPDQTANGTCRKWFGHCRTQNSGAAVNFRVFDDFYVHLSGLYESVSVNSAAQACVPDLTGNVTCHKWFGLGKATDGRPAACTVFDDGGTNRTDSGDAILFLFQPAGACTPGACRKWWGMCHAY